MQFHVVSRNLMAIFDVHDYMIHTDKPRQVHSLDFMAPASDDHISLICFLGAQGAKSQEDLQSQ